MKLTQDIPLYSARSQDVRLMAEDYLTFVQKLYQHFPNPDLVCVRIGNHLEYYVFDPAFMREVLVERPVDFPRHQESIMPLKELMGASLMNLEDNVWRKRRLTLSPIFSPKAALLDGERGRIGAADRIAALIKESHDAEESMTRMSMRMMFQITFSINDDRYLDLACNAIRQLSVNGTKDKLIGRVPDEQLSARKIIAKSELVAIVDSLIAARNNQSPTDDVLGRLLSASDDAGNLLNINEVRDECLAIFIAGHITTASSLTWWSIYLGKNPEAQQRASQEVRNWRRTHPDDPITAAALPYVVATIKEAMRLRPAAGVLLSRVAASDTSIGPYQVPQGGILRLLPAVLHLDPRWFPEPELFRPERFLDNEETPRGAYIPYGNGPRICIGLHLANIELLCMATQLLEHTEWTLMEPGASVGHKICFALLPGNLVPLSFKIVAPEI